MRASVKGNLGQLIIDDCQILRYIENGNVRKFYQQFLIRFDPDGASMSRMWWSVSNWGAGAEAPCGSDLKGQLKHTEYTSEHDAIQSNTTQVYSKVRRGYLHYSQYGRRRQVDPPPKMLATIGAYAQTSRPAIPPRSGPVPTNPAFTRPTRVDKSDLLDSPSTDLQLMLKGLQSEVNDFAEVIMNALGDGDIPRAISHRHSLVNLLDAVTALQDNATGQLEVANAKLAAALS